jgi:hypothetical protein
MREVKVEEQNLVDKEVSYKFASEGDEMVEEK